MPLHLPWCDPQTGEAWRDDVLPAVDGVPVLVTDPAEFLARHGPRTTPADRARPLPHEPLPVDAPDPLTPHLPPGRWPAALQPAGPFGAWLASLGDRCPDAVCAAWGLGLAPSGPVLDAGCGVGGMARRMASAGRPVVAFDRSPDAVLLARDLLAGRLPDVPVCGARSQATRMTWPHPAVPDNGVQWAIADVLEPPLPLDSLAWVHLGSVVDMVPAGAVAVVDAVAPLLVSGGVLTVATPHDDDRVPHAHAPDPGAVLREALHALGFEVVREDRSVPWVVRQYDRGYRVLLTDCIAARATW